MIKLVLPPLRKRREDIPLLVEHFIERFNCTQGKSITGVSTEAMAFFMAHDWPGNVRELENLIEHAFVLCDKGRIDLKCLPDDFITHAPLSQTRAGMSDARRSVEAHAIREALLRTHGNRIAAARELGIHKSTLFRKIKTLGIKPIAPRSGHHS